MSKKKVMDGAALQIVCEVQQWTTTSVADAEAARERFIPVAAQSDDLDGARCEVFRWAEASVEQVVKMKVKENGMKMRCVECKQPVRFQGAKLTVGSPAPHFAHIAPNLSCSRSAAA